MGVYERRRGRSPARPNQQTLLPFPHRASAPTGGGAWRIGVGWGEWGKGTRRPPRAPSVWSLTCWESGGARANGPQMREGPSPFC